jgi:hypothetical protein
MSNFFITVPASSNFSFRDVLPTSTVIIPQEQQMLSYQEVSIQDTGELAIEGELVILD